jgi:chromosome partitioning protein
MKIDAHTEQTNSSKLVMSVCIIIRSGLESIILVGYKRAASKKILVINRKGGAGKSTLAISIASLYAHHGKKTEIIDLDPQETSYFWGSKNADVRAQKYQPSSHIPFSLALRLEADTEITVVDSPSNFSLFEMEKYVSMVDKIVFPLQPSPIDIHSMLKFVKQLISSKVFSRNNVELAFVITRASKSNIGHECVENVLKHMKYPLLGAMTEDNCYQEMFSTQTCFLDINPEVDDKLWQKLTQWVGIEIPNKEGNLPDNITDFVKASDKKKQQRRFPFTLQS